MLNALERCEGAFIGHAIASKYDPSTYMSLNVCESLIDCKKFNGPDILSRHLNLYHTKKCEIGDITKYIYQVALIHTNEQSTLTRENFLFNQSIIDETVVLADKKHNGHTAGCSPAQRSYPIAFCAFIQDDDVFDFTMLEAKLTHFNPLAGQVAGIVNLICRSLLKNESWNNAVSSAFTTANLHEDIKVVLARHHRFPTPIVETHPGYAPTVLNAALHCIVKSNNATQAIAQVYGTDKHYCAPIVGILAGARWGIPDEMYKDNINDVQLKTLREAASKLNNFWKIKLDSPLN